LKPENGSLSIPTVYYPAHYGFCFLAGGKRLIDLPKGMIDELKFENRDASEVARIVELEMAKRMQHHTDSGSIELVFEVRMGFGIFPMIWSHPKESRNTLFL
jgi:hypothetical protein